MQVQFLPIAVRAAEAIKTNNTHYQRIIDQWNVLSDEIYSSVYQTLDTRLKIGNSTTFYVPVVLTPDHVESIINLFINDLEQDTISHENSLRAMGIEPENRERYQNVSLTPRQIERTSCSKNI